MKVDESRQISTPWADKNTSTSFSHFATSICNSDCAMSTSIPTMQLQFGHATSTLLVMQLQL